MATTNTKPKKRILPKAGKARTLAQAMEATNQKYAQTLAKLAK